MDLNRAIELLNYDPETGALTSRVHRQGAPVGKKVGHVIAKGHLIVGLDGRQYPAHRLVYWMVMGEPAVNPVVALNLNITDLRWVNLHQVTAREIRAFREWQMEFARRANPKFMVRGHVLAGEGEPEYRQTDREVEAGKRWPARPAKAQAASPEPQPTADDADPQDPLW